MGRVFIKKCRKKLQNHQDLLLKGSILLTGLDLQLDECMIAFFINVENDLPVPPNRINFNIYLTMFYVYIL